MFNFLFKKKKKSKRRKTITKIQEKNFYFEFNNSSQIDYFIENLGILVSSGMPIVDALKSIIKEISSPKLKYLINKIIEEIENGSTIWKALERSKLFKEHTLSLIRLGEESGKLVQNLKVLTTEEQKTKSLKSKMKAAMMYPGFVMIIMAVVGIGISWLILPKLATVFSQLKLELPLITKLLIDLGSFLGEYGIYVVPLFVIFLIFIFYFLFIFKKSKYIGQKILYAIPGIGRLMKEVEIARFGYLLGTLLHAGIPINTALESLSGITELLKYKKLYEHLNTSIYEGNTFNKAFDSFSNMKKLIPAPIQQLIVAGEQSGTLDKTLLRIGEMYSEKSDITTKNLTSILEPILLVIVWLGVVSIALAVILPIYGLVGGLNTG